MKSPLELLQFDSTQIETLIKRLLMATTSDEDFGFPAKLPMAYKHLDLDLDLVG